MNILIIAHGNKKTGMGHIMRSLSLAQAFNEYGNSVLFYSRYEEGARLVENNGFKVKSLEIIEKPYKNDGFSYGDYRDLQQDLKCILEINSEKKQIIIVDSYNVTSEYLVNMHAQTYCLVYIDDINAFSYPVDIILNGTASAFNMNYPKNQTALQLLGMKYNLLRKEFCHIPAKTVRPAVTDVLITTGNSDPYHMTEQILDSLLTQDLSLPIHYHVIIGGGFSDSFPMDNRLYQDKHLTFYHHPTNIQEIMINCDLAVTAGGSTLYELSACGVPAIAFAYAENQLPQIKALVKQGLLKYAGYYHSLDATLLIKHFLFLTRHFEFRKKLSLKLQSQVDGYGAMRAAKEISLYAAIEIFHPQNQ